MSSKAGHWWRDYHRESIDWLRGIGIQLTDSTYIAIMQAALAEIEPLDAPLCRVLAPAVMRALMGREP